MATRPIRPNHAALLTLALAALGIGLLSTTNARARESAPPDDDGPFRRVTLRAGTYTSLVFGNGSSTLTAVVELATPQSFVPVVIGPGQTVTIDFPEGLVVSAAEQVIIDATPGRFSFRTESVRSGLLSVFAVGPAGPVALTPTR